MPKSVKKGPYVHFCLEQSRIKPSLKGKSLPQLVSLCSESWNNLSPREKEQYVSISKNEVAGVGHVKQREKFDCFGRSLTVLKEQERESQENDRLRRRDIQKRASLALKDSIFFHFMDVTEWVCTRDGESIPVEISIVSLNLIQGITKRWVQKIHPGTPPLGYRADMKKNSDTGHGIWLDDIEELNADYKGIFSRLKDILTPSLEEGPAVKSKLLPVFVNSDKMENIESSMKWLAVASGHDLTNDNRIVPYEAHILLWDLVSLSPYKSSEVDIPTMNLAKAHLERDSFPNIVEEACEFHGTNDNANCALLKATRMAFIIAEFSCLVYDLEANEGKHYPSGSTRLAHRLNNTIRRDTLNFSSDSIHSSSDLNISYAYLNFKKPPLDPSISIESGESQDAHPLKQFLELHKFRDLEELMLKSGNCDFSILENATSLTGRGGASSLMMDNLSEVTSLCTLDSRHTSLSIYD